VVLVLKAAAFAAHKHRDQRRKDVKATPYINHPLAVAQALCEEGDVDDPIILAAALLHDTIEDTETTYVELRGQFGARIADIVAEVTDTKFLGKREYFDWAKAVLDQIRQSDPRLAERFDAVWEAGR
jgi:guanosine-3',5'-bis(diphosphate) 3'-pyrophosphohydrolase